MSGARRAAVIVLGGVGIGEAPDAATYGDAGSNTLGNIARALRGLQLPNLQRAGLGNIAPLEGCAPSNTPTAAHGMLIPASVAGVVIPNAVTISGTVLE